LNEEQPSQGTYHSLPGESEVLLIHKPPTEEERKILDEAKTAEAEKAAQRSDRQRELRLAVANIRLSQWNIYISWFIAVGTLIGSGAGFYQGCQARRSADAAYAAIGSSKETLSKTLGRMDGQIAEAKNANAQAKEAFIKDQRPYLAQTNKSTESPQQYSNPKTPGVVQIVWSWHMTNYGKTPANDILISQEMSLGNGIYLPSYGGNGKKGGKAHDLGGSQPPGGESFDTVISAPMKQEDAQKILDSEDGVSFRVKITYRDLSGNSYDSAICMRRTNAGAIAYCKQDNYIH
jgi:hypothetical protein